MLQMPLEVHLLGVLHACLRRTAATMQRSSWPAVNQLITDTLSASPPPPTVARLFLVRCLHFFCQKSYYVQIFVDYVTAVGALEAATAATDADSKELTPTELAQMRQFARQMQVRASMPLNG